MPEEVLDLLDGDGDESAFFGTRELFRRGSTLSQISGFIICSVFELFCRVPADTVTLSQISVFIICSVGIVSVLIFCSVVVVSVSRSRSSHEMVSKNFLKIFRFYPRNWPSSIIGSVTF